MFSLLSTSTSPIFKFAPLNFLDTELMLPVLRLFLLVFLCRYLPCDTLFSSVRFFLPVNCPMLVQRYLCPFVEDLVLWLACFRSWFLMMTLCGDLICFTPVTSSNVTHCLIYVTVPSRCASFPLVVVINQSSTWIVCPSLSRVRVCDTDFFYLCCLLTRCLSVLSLYVLWTFSSRISSVSSWISVS